MQFISILLAFLGGDYTRNDLIPCNLIRIIPCILDCKSNQNIHFCSFFIKNKGPLTVVMEVTCIAAYYFEENKSWSNTPVSCISLLLVPILLYWIQVSVSLNVLLYFGAEMATFCIKHIENRKIFFLTLFPPRAPTNPFAGKRVIIFYIIYVNGLLGPGGGEQFHTAINAARKPEPKYVTWYNYLIRKQNSKN